jgi:hypothetical protein
MIPSEPAVRTPKETTTPKRGMDKRIEIRAPERVVESSRSPERVQGKSQEASTPERVMQQAPNLNTAEKRMERPREARNSEKGAERP